MKQLFLGVLFMGLLASPLVAEKTCYWTEHKDSSMLYGVAIEPPPTVANAEECKDECVNSANCELAEFTTGSNECRLFSYDYTEALLLEYVYAKFSTGKTLYECTLVEYCSCSLIGDPWVQAFDGSTKYKLETNGVYTMAQADIIGSACNVEATVRTAVTDPNRPNRSVVTHLTVKVGDKKVDAIHTPLVDEVAGILVDGVPITLPNGNPDPWLFITEHSGAVFIKFENCDVSLIFQDFKNSRATITLDSLKYGSALEGLCGKCGPGGFSGVVPENYLLSLSQTPAPI